MDSIYFCLFLFGLVLFALALIYFIESTKQSKKQPYIIYDIIHLTHGNYTLNRGKASEYDFLEVEVLLPFEQETIFRRHVKVAHLGCPNWPHFCKCKE